MENSLRYFRMCLRATSRLLAGYQVPISTVLEATDLESSHLLLYYLSLLLYFLLYYLSLLFYSDQNVWNCDVKIQKLHSC